MSYQVIARKYRPQTFADLTGQEHISRTLSHALDQQRLHHAYLFSGVRGTGKTTSARIVAKGLNCHTGVTSRPCLQCPSCLEIAAGNALDVLEIDAASNTGVDNVRDVIINNLALAPARDRYKVFVIDEVHMLSNSAFNALLKTLEEPPRHVVFLMATTELHKVPDTILSRCQQFEFRHIPTEKIFRRLREIADREAVRVNDAALRELARAGAGSLRDAQSAFDQVIAFSGEQITEQDVATALGLVEVRMLGNFAAAIAERGTAKIVELAGEITARGYDLRNFTRELTAYFRHLLVVKSGLTGGELIGVADIEIGRLKELAGKFSEADLVRCFHLLAAAEKEIKDSPHPHFQLELSLVKLAHATRLRSLDELLTRLSQLEARLGGGGAAPISAGPTAAPRERPPSKAPDKPMSPVAKNLSAAVPSPAPAKVTQPPALATPAPTPPAAVTQAPAPTKPIAAPRPMPTAPEPPDMPDFDDYEPSMPLDLDDADFMPSPRRAAPTATPSARVAQPALERKVTTGREVEAILQELQNLNRHLIVTALEAARSTEFKHGNLIATFDREDVLARRLRDSGALLREVGQKLFGQPLTVEVRIAGQSVGKAEEKTDEAAAAQAELRRRAEAVPAVRLLLDKFRGEIVNVRPAEKK